MDFWLATVIDDFQTLKKTAQELDLYASNACWLVIGEDAADKRAFLKVFSLKRNRPTYFLSLGLARKFSPTAFSGKGGAINAALLTGVVTKKPVLIVEPGVRVASKEVAKLQATEAEAVAGRCQGYSRNANVWIEEIYKALQAYQQGVVSKAFCTQKIQEALAGRCQSDRPILCNDALYVTPSAAQKVCFPPDSAEPIRIWLSVAEALGVRIAWPTKAWAAHIEPTIPLFKEWAQETQAQALQKAIEYILKKASFRTYSDYLLDEACDATLATHVPQSSLTISTLEQIAGLKNEKMNNDLESLIQSLQVTRQTLQKQGRLFFTTLKKWAALLEKAKEERIIHLQD